MKRLIIISIVFYLQLSTGIAQNLFKGVVVDSDTGNPLPYVNIGIVNSSVGTVSNERGEFTLPLTQEIKSSDTLRFSSIGYQSFSWQVSEVKKQFNGESMVVKMKKATIELKQIVISSKGSKEKILGNKTQSRAFGGGFGTKDLGSEIGVMIPIKHQNTLIENFNFFISHNTYDSLTFRVKIYKMKNDRPYEDILHNNVIIKVGKTTGNISVDLLPYNIVADDNFLICIEWLDRKGQPGSILNISAGLFGSTYIKTASQGVWVVKKGVGLGFNVKANIMQE